MADQQQQPQNPILTTIAIQPGIRKDLTDYQAEGGWVDSNRIRFKNGRAQTLGGWARENFFQDADNTITTWNGVARDIHAWATLDSKRLLAVASHTHVELEYDGEIYDITPAGLPVGTQDNIPLIGWSGGTYDTPGAGGQGYNRPRNALSYTDMRQWSLDNWGEDLIACDHKGKIYQWDRTGGPGTPMTQITNSPDVNHMILIAKPQRVLIALGSETFATSIFDPLIIRWAAIGTLTDWAISSLSTAGEYRLPTGNRIVSAVQTRSEILVFTDVDVYAMRFVGGVDIFQFTCLGDSSCTSLHSPIDAAGIVYWQGVDKFYMYDGQVQILYSTLDKYIFDSEDGEGRYIFEQKEKTFAGINKEFNEIWWFYQRFDDLDCGHYIKYNFIERVWDFGTLNRTVWADKGIFPKPYALSDVGVLYTHEVGITDDSQPMNAFITSAYFDIGDGDSLVFVDKIAMDIDMRAGSTIQVDVFTKKYPHARAKVIRKGPYLFQDIDDKLNIRARGRQMALKFSCLANNSDFDLGKIRLAIEPDGGR